MSPHEWRLDRAGEHFVLTRQVGDIVERFPLTDANALRLADDCHRAFTGLVINVMGMQPARPKPDPTGW